MPPGAEGNEKIVSGPLIHHLNTDTFLNRQLFDIFTPPVASKKPNYPNLGNLASRYDSKQCIPILPIRWVLPVSLISLF